MFKNESFRRATILSLGIVAAASAGAASLKDLAAQQVIVQLPDKSRATMKKVLDELRSKSYTVHVADRIPARPVYLLQIDSGGTGQKAAYDLNHSDNSPHVFAEVNRLVSSDPWLHRGGTKAKENSVLAIGEDAKNCPDQSKCEPEDVGTLLRLDDAHAKSTGAGVRVAVLDTGTDPNHPELAGAFGDPPVFRDFLDRDTDATEGGTAITDLNDFGRFSVGHGTHVTGIIHRVAPNAQIMVGRILDPQGVGTTWLTGKGIFWAIDPTWTGLAGTGAHVINLSLDTKFETEMLRLAVNVVTCANVPDPAVWDKDAARCDPSGENLQAVVSAAAGNDGSETLEMYPAAYAIPGLISVAASDNRPGYYRVKADFTNWGSYVDVAAPGEVIFSQFFDDSKATISGTSMAAPMVSGLAALVKGLGPNPNARDARAIVGRIKNRAVPMCGTDTLTFKHIDALATVDDAATPLDNCP